MHHRLQPRAPQAATPCATGCNLVYPRLQPCVSQVRAHADARMEAKRRGEARPVSTPPNERGGGGGVGLGRGGLWSAVDEGAWSLFEWLRMEIMEAEIEGDAVEGGGAALPPAPTWPLPLTKAAAAERIEEANDHVAETRGVGEVRRRGVNNGDDEEEEANDLASEPCSGETIVLHKESTASELGLGLSLFSGDVIAHPRVQLVKPGSLAYASGRFQAMDIITAVNDMPIATDKEALDIIISAQGDVRFTVLRDGSRLRKTSSRPPVAVFENDGKRLDLSGMPKQELRALQSLAQANGEYKVQVEGEDEMLDLTPFRAWLRGLWLSGTTTVGVAAEGAKSESGREPKGGEEDEYGEDEDDGSYGPYAYGCLF